MTKTAYPPLPKPGSPDCPVRGILAHLGDKWSTLVITSLAGGSLRFGEIKRRVEGISQRMLTETVRNLERDGMVLRTVYPTIPPKVEYTLTPLGESFVPLVMALIHWALEHRSEIYGARAVFDEDRDMPLAPVPARRIGV